jgi:hypothetical protein
VIGLYAFYYIRIFAQFHNVCMQVINYIIKLSELCCDLLPPERLELPSQLLVLPQDKPSIGINDVVFDLLSRNLIQSE